MILKPFHIPLLSLFLFLFLSYTPVRSNDLSSIITFADSLAKKKNYSIALHEYQRALFFAEDENKCLLSEKIANCHFILENYKPARIFYDSAAHYSLQEEVRLSFTIQKVLTYMMETNFGYALLQLDTIKLKGHDILERRKCFYQGICHFGMEQYDRSYEYLLKSVPPGDTLRLALLNQLFESRKNLTRPNSSLATLFSIVVPGSGQLYSGEIKDGLNSLILAGGLFYLGVSNTLLPPLATIPIFYRYYMGGIMNAPQAAGKRREKKKADYFSLMTDIISADTGSIRGLFHPEEDAVDHSVFLQNSESEMQVLVSFAFLFYKEFISSQDVEACVFHPSCSEYTIQAVENKGAFFGLLDGFDRLLRCHYFVTPKDYSYDIVKDKYYDPL